MEAYIAENIMEITSMFICLVEKGKIELEDKYTKNSTWSLFKTECLKWAEEFKDVYDHSDDYIDSISEFAEEKILKEYGKKKVFYNIDVHFNKMNDEELNNMINKLKLQFPKSEIVGVYES